MNYNQILTHYRRYEDFLTVEVERVGFVTIHKSYGTEIYHSGSTIMKTKHEMNWNELETLIAKL